MRQITVRVKPLITDAYEETLEVSDHETPGEIAAQVQAWAMAAIEWGWTEDSGRRT